MKRETFTIDDHRSKKLRDFCREKDMKMSAVIRQSLDLFFIREAKKKKKTKVD